MLPAEALRFTLTWGLGGMAAFMVMLQLCTGILLGFVYQPVPVQAYLSVRSIQEALPIGPLLRNLHHWTGHALVIVIFLHLLRIFFCGAFYPPRRRNWLIGLGLGFLVVSANFSGYLLPWDQLSFWAVTIATSMLGYIPVIGPDMQTAIQHGPEVGAATLQLFYGIHILLVPVLLFVLMAYHFWSVRRAGGILIPGGRKSNDRQRVMVPFVPQLLVRECSMAAMVFCILLLFSMVVDAPLGDMADSNLTPALVRAPWYFAGLQELLLHVPPVIAVCVLPLAVTVLLVALPFTRQPEKPPGVVASIVVVVFLFGVAGLTLFSLLFRGPAMELVRPW